MFGPSQRGITALKRSIIVFALVFSAAGFLAAGEPLSFTGQPCVELPQLLLLDKAALKPVGDRLRICSYNAENFGDGIRDDTNATPATAERHARGIASLVDEINPDIIVLEEVENALALKKLNDALKKPYPVAFITRFASTAGYQQKLNIAVLSRVPLSGLRELDFEQLQGRGRPPRGMLSFFVELGGGRRLLVYGAHLKSNFGDRVKNEFQRLSAMKLLRADADKMLSRYPQNEWEVLVMGDMNVDPEDPQFAKDPTFRPMRGWVDLWLGRPLAERTTLPTRHGDPALEFPPVTFDRFFASTNLMSTPWIVGQPQVLQRGVDTKSVFTLPGQGDVHVSDHYPIYLDIVK
jgi:endonuclease/exonuclease/phosphatase family metal-dependent hydrolase